MHKGFETLDKQTTALETIATCLTEVKDKLLDSAIGRRHVDLVTFGSVVACLGGLLAAAAITIGFLLVGEKAGWIRELFR